MSLAPGPPVVSRNDHTDDMVAGVLFDLFGTIVAPFSTDRHDHALTLAAEALGLDPDRCISAWEADYHNRVRGRSGDIAAQLQAMAEAQGIEVNPGREAAWPRHGLVRHLLRGGHAAGTDCRVHVAGPG
jgi:hypothetical protein